jgi:hypothetical protein
METGGNRAQDVFELLAINLELDQLRKGVARGIKFLEIYHLIGAYYPSHWYNFS